MDETSPKSTNSGRLRQKLSRVLLFGGLAAIIIWSFRAQPLKLEVVYNYGEASRNLIKATMIYRQNGEEIRRIIFDYEQRAAANVQLHQVSLPKGDYQIDIELVYPREVPAAWRGKEKPLPNGHQMVSIQRFLPVKSKGQLYIYLLS